MSDPTSAVSQISELQQEHELAKFRENAVVIYEKFQGCLILPEISGEAVKNAIENDSTIAGNQEAVDAFNKGVEFVKQYWSTPR